MLRGSATTLDKPEGLTQGDATCHVFKCKSFEDVAALAFATNQTIRTLTRRIEEYGSTTLPMSQCNREELTARIANWNALTSQMYHCSIDSDEIISGTVEIEYIPENMGPVQKKHIKTESSTNSASVLQILERKFHLSGDKPPRKSLALFVTNKNGDQKKVEENRSLIEVQLWDWSSPSEGVFQCKYVDENIINPENIDRKVHHDSRETLEEREGPSLINSRSNLKNQGAKNLIDQLNTSTDSPKMKADDARKLSIGSIFNLELKNEGRGLGFGFKMIPPANDINAPDSRCMAVISRIVEESPASKQQNLCLGDQILEINHVSVVGTTARGIIDMLKSASGSVVNLCLLSGAFAPNNGQTMEDYFSTVLPSSTNATDSQLQTSTGVPPNVQVKSVTPKTIKRQGQIPHPWIELIDEETGHLLFFNSDTKESSFFDPRDKVVKVILVKGEDGLGIGLKSTKNIGDGHEPLKGIFIKTLLEGGAGKRCGKLSEGDEVHAINGTSMISLQKSDAIAMLKSVAPGETTQRCSPEYSKSLLKVGL
eukprot:UC4_evm6s507